LQPVFNTIAVTTDDEPTYKEIVALVTGIALLTSSRMDQDGRLRMPELSANVVKRLHPDIHCEQIQLEYWRILEAADLIFFAILVNKGKASS
jgi:hypothetical protein